MNKIKAFINKLLISINVRHHTFEGMSFMFSASKAKESLSVILMSNPVN